MQFDQKDTKELEKLYDYYSKLHKQAMEAYRSDNIKKWDEKAKEYMEKKVRIEQILFERKKK